MIGGGRGLGQKLMTTSLSDGGKVVPVLLCISLLD